MGVVQVMSVKLDRRSFIGTAVAFGAICAVSPATAFGVTSAEKKAEIQEIKAKLDSLEEEYSVAVDNYNAANIAYDDATSKVEKCKKKIKKTEEKLKSLQTHLSTRATSMYRSGSMSYLDVLLGVGSFDDFASVWDTLNSLNEDDADLVAENKVAKAELETAKKDLVANQQEAEDQLASAASYKESLEAKEAEYQSTINNLNDEYQQLLEEEREAEEAERRRQAAAVVAASAASAPSNNDGGGSSNSNDGDSSDSSDSSDSGSDSSYSGDSTAVERAYSCLGKPYVYGTAGPDTYDCSGLVSYALTGVHSHVWVSQSFWAMPAVSNPQPGDVVACHAGHCGLYIGDGMMIEASSPSAGIRISAVRGKIVRP